MQKDAHSEAFKSKWVPFKQRDLAGIFGVVISTFSHTDLWSISFILGPGNSRYTRMGTTSCFSLETSHQIITACHRGEQAPLGWQLFGSPVRSEVVFFDAKKPLKQTHRHTHTQKHETSAFDGQEESKILIPTRIPIIWYAPFPTIPDTRNMKQRCIESHPHIKGPWC